MGGIEDQLANVVALGLAASFRCPIEKSQAAVTVGDRKLVLCIYRIHWAFVFMKYYTFLKADKSGCRGIAVTSR